MQANIGSVDKIIRIIAGIAILVAGFFFQSWFGLIGIIPIATAFIGICPAYIPLGLSTCKVNPDASSQKTE
ncbi:Protein of unknown function (DUF2892) [Beggiatoa alba B18LD]|uniref:Inner membrane protein YgaP-like transmembrane domain-containing protein n=1 Tax=Beggiatoa alba B18LD TaxID=395493 RepID=I3CCV5_9GAMM|nr:DUF2892 domain-containing protein [Beggiatoa alba]EIJ41448.1 Protein of unknown function (DUF2892) [Beggiatoa alba B18LD]